MPAMFVVTYICNNCSRCNVCILNMYICTHIFLYDEGDSVIERTKREKYSAIKDVVIQYCQIQHSIRFEAMCNLVIQPGCT